MWRLVDRVIEWLAALCLAASALMIFANVIHRYVVLGWMRDFAEHAEWFAPVFDFLGQLFLPAAAAAGEVPGYLLVWISFLGAFLAQRNDIHIRFEGVTDMLPAPVRNKLRTAVYCMLVALFFLLLFQSIRMIRVNGETEIESAEIAEGWFMLVIPITACLLIAAFIKAALDERKKNQ